MEKMICVTWPDKSKGFYVMRLSKSGTVTGYLTPQGGWSERRRLATMFPSAEAAELRAKLKSNNYTILNNL